MIEGVIRMKRILMIAALLVGMFGIMSCEDTYNHVVIYKSFDNENDSNICVDFVAKNRITLAETDSTLLFDYTDTNDVEIMTQIRRDLLGDNFKIKQTVTKIK